MASSEEQQLSQSSRGYAVLISNEEFPFIDVDESRPEDPTRKGADKDDTNLQYIFNTKLGFQLLDKKTYKNVYQEPLKSNVRKEHWIHNNHRQNEKCPCPGHDSLPPNERCPCQCISCRIQTTDHSDSEGFVLAISTHGVQVDRKQVIAFSDDYGDERVKLSDIIKTLNDKNCKTLKGKPRIILLQVCRSDPDVPKDKQNIVWHDPGHNVERSLENLKIKKSETSQTAATNHGEESEVSETAATNHGEESEGSETAATNHGEESEASETAATNHGEESEASETAATSHGEESEASETAATDHGVEIEASETAATNNGTGEPQEIADTDVEGVETNDPENDYFYNTEEALRNLPSEFLIIFPTVSGKKTWHNFEHGSWLIQELREVVENFKTPDMNFLTVLTKTAENVALKKESKEGYKCAVCIVHRLLRPIIFRGIRDTSQEQPSLAADRPAL